MIKQITAEELNSVISSGFPENSILVDVRTEAECAKGIIKGAKNIPVNDILAAKPELTKYKNIYLYCFSGSRSDLAATLLNEGFAGEIYNLENGLLNWRVKGYPVV